LEWLLSYTCWQTHLQDDVWENDESRDQALKRVTEKATLVVARLQSVKYYVFQMCVSSLSYLAHKAHAPYYIVLCGLSGSKVFM